MSERRIHIHLVEDSRVDVIVNSKLLQLMDPSFEISDYPSGEEFCEWALGNDIDDKQARHIVLLDIQLPGINGFDCIEQLRASRETKLNSIEIFMLSSSIDRNDIKRANQDPAVLHVLEKPLDVQLFRQLIAR